MSLKSLIQNNPYYQKPEVSSKFQGYMQGAAAITSLLPEDQNPYSFTPTDPLKGAAQGAQLGSAFGPVGAGIGAIAGGVGGAVAGVVNQYKQLDRTPTDVNALEYDEYGQPIFQGGQLAQAQQNLGQIEKVYAKKNFGDFNVRKTRETRNKLSAGIRAAQQDVNEANIAYSQNLLARQRYEDEMKKNNIYNFPMQLV
jgi:hypothetical protein